MALAQRLNELAAANSQGLLNDDEYRLLRQSVFEQHAASAAPPSEAPLVPIERKHTAPPRRSAPEAPPPPPPRGLLRRLTARRPPAPAPPPKRIPFLPRILQKRPADAPPPPIAIAYPAASPSSSNFSVPPPPPPRDVFDDDNLLSARAIRAAITAAEDEAARLADAFAALEAATLRRLRSQRARRLPAATPASVAVLLEGREWREHRLVPSPSAPALARARAPSDASVRTASTAASRQPPPPASPLSARFRLPALRRKASLSSLSSHTPSLAPSGSTLPSLAPSGGSSTPGASSTLPAPAPFLARSASALGLRRLARAPSTDTLATPTPIRTPTPTAPPPRSPPHTPRHTRTRTPTSPRPPNTPTRAPSTPTRAPNTPTRALASPPASARSPPHRPRPGADDADDAELADIRARRDALVARYTARVEFLRAKLRGAELHERLLRK